MTPYEQLAADIQALVEFEHDGGEDGYSASADAMWKAASLAFEFAAKEVGATGFQASWAALRFYSEVLHIDCPFAVVQAEDAVYPQYDVVGRVRGLLNDDWRGWITEQAAAKLAEYEARPTFTYTDTDGVEQTSDTVALSVVNHWRRIVAGQVTA